jgi:hypothetical protein
MVLSNNAGIDFANYVKDNWLYAQYGSGTILESASNTALVSPIATSYGPLSNTRSGQSIALVHEIVSTTANSTTMTEFAIYKGGVLQSRVTTTPIYKDSTKEVQTTTIIFVDIN